ncbi:hypothetical protein Pelo_17592 [Pelomyxa schiedti]|nr:hypothetical protein Pelo_17592 [Pelomyxa schiedti]
MSNDIHPQEGADAHAAARKNNKDRLLLVSKLLWDIVLPSTGITAATRPLSPSQTTTESSPATTTPDAVADETDRLLRRASYAAAIDYECEAVLWSSNNSDQPQPCRRDSAHDSLAWAAVGREPHLRPGALAAARESAATVLRLGEALFPLTPAACRHVARECAGSRTGALWAAARNGAVRCVAWMWWWW